MPNTLFDLEKEKTAIELLQRYEPVRGYYLSFSGGKDSVVLHEIAKRAGVKFDAHFANTTVEAPETMRFIRQFYPEVIWDKPRMTMRQAIIYKQRPPTRVMRYCCFMTKECHGSGHILLTGIRKAESVKRAKRHHIEISFDDCTKIMIHPIFYWSTDEVWGYIKANNLPVNPLYAEGRKRIGCVMCPMSGSEGMKRDAIRWPKIARRYRQYFQEMYDYHTARGHKFKGWESGDCIYDWWITQPKKDKDKGECLL